MFPCKPYSYAEIAKKMKISKSTVAGVINRYCNYYFDESSSYYDPSMKPNDR